MSQSRASVIIRDEYTMVVYRNPDTGRIHLSSQDDASATQSYVELTDADTRYLIQELESRLKQEDES